MSNNTVKKNRDVLKPSLATSVVIGKQHKKESILVNSCNSGDKCNNIVKITNAFLQWCTRADKCYVQQKGNGPLQGSLSCDLEYS